MNTKSNLFPEFKLAVVWRWRKYVSSPVARFMAGHFPEKKETPYAFDMAKNYWKNVPRAKGSQPIQTSNLENTPDDRIAGEFDREMEIANRKPERIKAFSLALESLRGMENPRIMDYGSGFGFNGINLLMNHSDARVTFADINKSNLLAIQKITRAKKFAHRADTSLVTDPKANNLHFEQKFDMIVSMGVLHHTPHAVDIVSHLSKYLKKNGFFLVMLYNFFYQERMALRKKRKLNANDFGEMTDPVVGDLKNPYSEPYDDEKAKTLFKDYDLISSHYPDPFYNMYLFKFRGRLSG